MRKSKHKPSDKSQLSIRALAANVGKSESAVRKWVRHADWQFGSGPWSRSLVPKIKAWARTMLAPDRAAGRIDPEPLTAGAKSKHQLEVEFLAEKIAEKKINRGLKLGGLINKKDVEAREVRQMQLVLEGFMSAKPLAVKMEGMSVMQREVLLETWARGCYTKVVNARTDGSDDDERQG